MKLDIRRNRDKYLRYAFIGMAAYCIAATLGNILSGSLAWHFATRQKTITTPMIFNQPFSSDASSADSPAMTMFALSFLYMRLNVSPENIDGQQKLLLGYVPAESRNALKKALDVEADRIKKGGITWRYDTRALRMIKPGVIDADVVLHPSTTNGNITTDLKEQARTYQLRMSYENGIIRLLDMTELVPATTN
ncbi:conjugal transfer protein TraE (plasmid) [Kosakonia radicincitans]|uniref:TraE/TraK family type IV conjugative transfer system protein n=1 Tax=Kosakonia radicincitans TaxID=283686 RepID=UPI0011EBADAB|nr:TraE/TraK family type IV conjugative transfer system protein [Kosakonia radicincitans]QEM94301.1 conjugal transfer protein TraE [Kosakonia radicincitans]